MDIGIIKDGKYLTISDSSQPYFYVPLAQNYGSSEVLTVRSKSSAGAVVADVRQEINKIAPGLPLTGVQTMLERLDETGGIASLRMSALLAAALGGLGLTLALVGLFGVVSYAVEQRAREMGIRMALGAPKSAICRLVLGQALIILGAGLTIGAILSLASAPVLRRFLIGISATDPITYAEVATLLSLVTLMASYVPVRRSMRIDPAAAVRYE